MPTRELQLGNDTVVFDLDDPRQKKRYEEELAKQNKTPEKETTIQDRLMGALKMGAIGTASGAAFGGGGAVPGGVGGAISGFIAPPEKPSDYIIGALGGAGAAGTATTAAKAAAKAGGGRTVNVLAQMLGGTGWGLAENTAGKIIDNPSRAKDPMSLAPTPGELAGAVLQGGLGGMFANMGKTPSAQTAMQMGESNPSKLRRIIEEGDSKLDPTREVKRTFDQLPEQVAAAKAQQLEQIALNKKNEIQQKATLGKSKAVNAMEKANEVKDLSIENLQATTTRDTLTSHRKQVEQHLSDIEADIKKNGKTPEREAAKAQALSMIDNFDNQLNQHADEALNRAKQKVETLKFTPEEIQREKVIRDNIAKTQKELVDRQTSLKMIEHKIQDGTFADPQIASLFKRHSGAKGTNTESLIDDLMTQDPKTIKSYFDAFQSQGPKAVQAQKDAVLQRIMAESFDPQSNSFANGLSYFSKIGGNPRERLAQVIGKDEADRLLPTIEEIAKTATNFNPGSLKGHAVNLSASALYFMIKHPNATDLGTAYAAATAGHLIKANWGPLLNKLASSEKFNSAFKDWMKNGASAEILKKSDYLMSQLRDLGAEEYGVTPGGNLTGRR